MMMISSCERTEIQKSTVKDDGRIIPRTGFCDNCAVDDCCCSIELKDVNSHATLRLCGTDDGIGSCSATPPSPCVSISGGAKFKIINSSDPKLEFCMVKGNSFYVRNAGIDSAFIIITCQHDITTPQVINAAIAPGSYYYVGTNNSCEVSHCQ